MASSSSINIIAGEFFSASSKAFLKLLSDSPANLLMISGPLIRKKNAPVSLATARAIKVLPVPGGPYNRIPEGAKSRYMKISNKSIGTIRSTKEITVLVCYDCVFQYNNLINAESNVSVISNKRNNNCSIKH